MEPKDNSSPDTLFKMLEFLAQNQTLPTWAVEAADAIWVDLVADLDFPKEIPVGAQLSLGAYTYKGRTAGLLAVLGEARLNQFQAFIDETADKYGDKLQPTEEKGYTKIGVRRLLWDIICFAYHRMDPDLFVTHVNNAAFNGAIYAKEKKVTDAMKTVVSSYDGKTQLPASFPPEYPRDLAKFLKSWMNSTTSN